MSYEYIIHTKTKNLSFLKVYRYLREKGVENNKFFLRLYNKELENVDPHSKHLTERQKVQILDECKKNPYYFIREICLVDVPGGKVKFELHPGNLALTWSLINSIDTIVLLPRQQFKTVTITVTN